MSSMPHLRVFTNPTSQLLSVIEVFANRNCRGSMIWRKFAPSRVKRDRFRPLVERDLDRDVLAGTDHAPSVRSGPQGLSTGPVFGAYCFTGLSGKRTENLLPLGNAV